MEFPDGLPRVSRTDIAIFVVMSGRIPKGHNKSLLLYHFVCRIKYRGKVLSGAVSETFKRIRLEIGERYEIHFLEIGLDGDHVHFLAQSVPGNALKKVIGAVQSITAREIFRLHPEVEQMLWGGKFWTSGY